MSCQEAPPSVSNKTVIGSGIHLRLADRMPLPHLMAKVGLKKATPRSLVARMPSPEIAAKVGGPIDAIEQQMRRVQRRNAAQ